MCFKIAQTSRTSSRWSRWLWRTEATWSSAAPSMRLVLFPVSLSSSSLHHSLSSATAGIMLNVPGKESNMILLGASGGLKATTHIPQPAFSLSHWHHSVPRLLLWATHGSSLGEIGTTCVHTAGVRWVWQRRARCVCAKRTAALWTLTTSSSLKIYNA